MAAFREVAGYVERRVTLVARSEDVRNDVCHRDTGEVGDISGEQSRFTLAPLPRQIIVTHQSSDRTRHGRRLMSARKGATYDSSQRPGDEAAFQGFGPTVSTCGPDAAA
jgi:hypothetical protein